ncbi:MAG TPA: molybdopterin-binding/glycosyltransferase family 2 protein [Rhizomicrobium sp.]|jgi:molybdenum cofactor cytidylyltransferase|nr:molybdopterin-binding/glycosyltransferase family 2 protein [Rhizomicrobium sp.]
MQFETHPTAGCAGAILAHGVRAGDLSYRKGRLLSEADIGALTAAGIEALTIARLEPGDVREDDAARRIAGAAAGDGVRLGAAFTGRANLYALEAGVVLIDAARIDRLNRLDEAITCATLTPFARVAPRQMLATVKIIPFAAPKKSVVRAEALLQSEPLISVAQFRPHRAALVSTSLPGAKAGLLDKNRAALEARLKPLGSSIAFERRVAHDSEPLAAAIRDAESAGCDPILIFSASAISDRRDVVPAAVELAGGRVTAFGMPVDPGNLLLMGELGGRRVVGLPGCARSPKQNGFDFVLWRLLAGLPVGRDQIAGMGLGGLLTDIVSRPQPREAEAPRLARIGAVVLAAGLSSRMGSNKLLKPVDGKPMLRHAVEAALASAADPVIVVTGNEKAKIVQALAGLPVEFRDNPDYSKGLSQSLTCGIKALPPDSDGALILLGDMPGVTAPLLDRLIAAFAPPENRSICVPTHVGRRGNPVLWSKTFFPEMLSLEGDVGARALLVRHPEQVCEVEIEDDAPLTDIDTPEALAAYEAVA